MEFCSMGLIYDCDGDWYLHMIQTPLQGMIDSIGGAVLMSFSPFLGNLSTWFHDRRIMTGICKQLENQALLDKGIELTVKNGFIIHVTVLDQFINRYWSRPHNRISHLYVFFMANPNR